MCTWKRSFRRIMSLLLALSLCLSAVPMAYATEDVPQPTEETVAQTEPVETTEDTTEETTVATEPEETTVTTEPQETTTETEPEEVEESTEFVEAALDQLDVIDTPAMQAVDLPSNFYLTQQTNYTCTLCSAAMMMRLRMYLSNNSNWVNVTESSIKSTAWTNAGLLWNFTYSISGNSLSVSHANVSGISVSKLKTLLDNHPEGIVLYCGYIPHAVLVTDYVGDTFYCAETISGYSGKRIALASSWLGSNYGSQSNILNNATAYWYVSSYSIASDMVSGSELVASGVKIPTSINVGSMFPVTGVVSSGETITKVTAGVFDINGKMMTGKTVTPNSKSYNLGNVDPYVLFDSLQPGVYSYQITATNSSQTKNVIWAGFTVLANSRTIADGDYVFRPTAKTSMALEVMSDANLELAVYDNKEAQAFKVVHKGSGYYSLQSLSQETYLDVAYAGTTNGTNVGVWKWEGNANQLWQILPVGNNSWCLVPKCAPGLCLDIEDGILSAGQNAQIYSANLTNAQVFSIYQYSPTTEKSWTSYTDACYLLNNPIKTDIAIYSTVGATIASSTSRLEYFSCDRKYKMSDGTVRYRLRSGNGYIEFSVDLEVYDDHIFGEWTGEEPTCTKSATKKRTCTRCTTYESYIVEALGHDYKSVVTSPTCSEKGYTTYTCARCKDSYKDNYTNPTGKHTYGNWTQTKAATCTAKGSEKHVCTVCKAEETREISALGHAPEVRNAKEATKTEPGYTGDKVCKRCELVLEKGEEIPATGTEDEQCKHVFKMVYQIVAPTCLEYGTSFSRCQICHETVYWEVSPLGHDPEIRNAKEATKTESGYTGDKVCKRCETVLEKGSVIPATGTEEETPAGTVRMYRLYNKYTLEHLFLTNPDERDGLIKAGWNDEGTGWYAATSGETVYRLYNPFDDWHFYTKSWKEVQSLLPLGWTLDGPVSYDAGKRGVPIYRLFNPYESKNYHLYTTNVEERDFLVGLGWQLEGIAWYAVKAGEVPS